MDVASGILLLLLVAPAVYATTYTVGDSNGWAQGVNYDNWVSGKTFYVGDKLLFNYAPSLHSVDVVSSSDYSSCTSSNALKSYTTGTDTVTLSKTGTIYFICPTPNHCSGGMKLAVPVSAASTTPATPTTPSATPPSSNGTTPSTSTPSTTNTTTTSSPSGAARNLCNNINALVIGLGVSIVYYVLMV
ncbi:mavicyanin-like [Macadamia integrifolia]|uniref:mavicyanin-like n=1 Tax=Macadamia integrifolia TaxID=60698 RepID=UPI001C4E7FA0|nr:mavicyanin-like [Macadamia integrifolia]